MLNCGVINLFGRRVHFGYVADNPEMIEVMKMTRNLRLNLETRGHHKIRFDSHNAMEWRVLEEEEI